MICEPDRNRTDDLLLTRQESSKQDFIKSSKTVGMKGGGGWDRTDDLINSTKKVFHLQTHDKTDLFVYNAYVAMVIG